MSLAFSSDESQAIDRKVDTDCDERRDKSVSVEAMYEIDRCVRWIKEHKFAEIGLQFPDSMLGDSTTVSLKLGKMTKKNVFVLGDTSYGSCCVDEIAAMKKSADAIIHFGHSCLSPTMRLPVLYVFGRQVVDIEDCAKAFCKFFPDKSSRVILLYEVMYSHAIDALAEKLKDYENLVVSRLEIPGEDTKLFGVDDKDAVTKLHRHLPLPSGSSLGDHKVFYIGQRPSTLTNFMLTLKNCLFHSYNPKLRLSQVETLDVNKHLKRRYYCVEKAKDASLIGILVGTVGVKDFITIVEQLDDLIEQAGKTSYRFGLGKLNSAKLANFPQVEVFVNVKCVEATLVESRDFYQTIVTPYELEVALNRSREWTGDYIADFADLLPGAVSYVPSVPNTEVESDVSLITGKIRHVGLHTSSQVDDDDDSSTSIATRNEMKISAVHANAAGEFLTHQSWRGLEQCLGETPVAVIEEGQRGIACRYEGEDVK